MDFGKILVVLQNDGRNDGTYWGFIRRAGKSGTIFYHSRNVLGSVEVGDVVEYEEYTVTYGPHEGKQQARNVRKIVTQTVSAA